MKKKYFIKGAVSVRKSIYYALGTAVLTIGIFSGVMKIQGKTVKAESRNTETEKNDNSDEPGDLPRLRIGSAIFAPYFYVDEDGGYTGVDVEIATEACRRMGYRPAFFQMIWGEHDTLLDAGMIDCVWCSFSMNGREEMYQWAGPYLYSPEVVVVSADSKIESLEDLNGTSVAMEVDSKPEEYFLKSDEGTSLNVKNVQTYSSLDDAFTSFGKGYADAVAGHKVALEYFTSAKPELYRYLEPEIVNARLGVAFEKGNEADVAALLSETLDEMNQDGTIPDIVSRYGFSEEMLVGAQNTDGGSE